jgi:hypothetical protein
MGELDDPETLALLAEWTIHLFGGDPLSGDLWPMKSYRRVFQDPAPDDQVENGPVSRDWSDRMTAALIANILDTIGPVEGTMCYQIRDRFGVLMMCADYEASYRVEWKRIAPLPLFDYPEGILQADTIGLGDLWEPRHHLVDLKIIRVV